MVGDSGREARTFAKDKALEATKRTAITLLPESPLGKYDDGAPFDQVQYLEAKLILKPERFTSIQAFRDFGAIVKRTAEEAGVGFIEQPELNLRPEIREIVFGDTPDFRLYNNAFILRRRIRYVDGFPVGDPEVVLKFRHPDERAATEMDVRPNIDGACKIKFKAEALPLKDQPGGYRILFSHNCQFGLSQARRPDRLNMGTLATIFPALRRLGVADKERITVVNKGIVEEVLLPLGTLDFGKGVLAKCDVSLWRTRGEHKSLVGEFAFQVKFSKREAVAEKPKRRAGAFYMTLQKEVADWLALGVTKTAMVYRLNGQELQSHE
ncbi:hypothetical protein K9U39_09645 [Rhodoblastus acidophilus]|uniref:Uncharacterized protein n=1 Tax=Candidatus Rhodoblastus alkanivorans TaxID=2954117 RepID=A0ABS9Z8V0_9HYPH|nr:hypothetical protein [Candidatus Rhodoblastus alkanivorans]MCI4677990.1 hypothetical protein [Candidatus Rhodoblastus alkanivorans]MCI4683885.1 hypothetical protein [Candidatus Rhodoblastus alkanivorans]MDI4641203.1 hypothetical protein [Rhodoblastus acidophilus]